MFGRRAAYRDGYVKALDDLKSVLFEDVEQRARDRNPHTLATLSYTVIEVANQLIDRAIDVER